MLLARQDGRVVDEVLDPTAPAPSRLYVFLLDGMHQTELEHRLAFRWFGDAQLFVHPVHPHRQAHRHQLGQSVGILSQVFVAACIQHHAWQACTGWHWQVERNQAIGYGFEDDKDLIAIKERGDAAAHPGKGFHLALGASNADAVHAFADAAAANGGVVVEPARLWPEFGAGYFAAYVTDPDGWQLEAVYAR